MDNTRIARPRKPYKLEGQTPSKDQIKQISLLVNGALLALSMTGDHESKLLDWAHNDLINANRRICSELERLKGDW